MKYLDTASRNAMCTALGFSIAGELIANVLLNYTGKFYFESDNRLAQKAHNLINSSLEYRPSPNWGIEVYGKNLTDHMPTLRPRVARPATRDNSRLRAPMA